MMPVILYLCPLAVNNPSENIGNVLALYRLSQYPIGAITYITRIKPAATFAVANHGLARGLPTLFKKEKQNNEMNSLLLKTQN
jgi:hypothetical protein